jgi:hypothetical protein
LPELKQFSFCYLVAEILRHAVGRLNLDEKLPEETGSAESGPVLFNKFIDSSAGAVAVFLPFLGCREGFRPHS